jgi:hypothetical protein
MSIIWEDNEQQENGQSRIVWEDDEPAPLTPDEEKERRRQLLQDHKLSQSHMIGFRDFPSSGAVQGGVKSAILGDAEFPDLPSAREADLTGLRSNIAAATTLPGLEDERYAQALAKQTGLQVTTDANGNFMLVDPQTGDPVAYANKPGLDLEDVVRTGAFAAPFLAGGGLAHAGTRGLGLVGRTLAVGGADAAVDAAQQLASSGAAGDLEFDPLRSALAAGGGLIGELVTTPQIRRFFSGAKQGDYQAAAKAFLKEVGFPQDELQKLSTEQLDILGRRIGSYPDVEAFSNDSIRVLLDPNAPPLTRSQITQSPEALRAEQRGVRDTDTGREVRNVLDQQDEYFRNQRDRLLPTGTPEIDLVGGFKGQHDEAKKLADEQFNLYRDMTAEGTPALVDPRALSSSIDSVMDSIPVSVRNQMQQGEYKRLSKAVRKLETLKGIANSNIAEAIPHLDVDNLNEVVRVLDNMISKAPKGSVDFRQLVDFRQNFRNELTNLIRGRSFLKGKTEDLFGEIVTPGVGDQLNRANEAFSAFRGQYDSPTMQKVERLLEQEVDTEQFVQSLFGSGRGFRTGSTGAVRDIKQSLKQQPLDRQQQVMTSIRDSYLKRILDTDSQRAIHTSLDKLFKDKELRDAVFTDINGKITPEVESLLDDLDSLRRALKVINRIDTAPAKVTPKQHKAYRESQKLMDSVLRRRFGNPYGDLGLSTINAMFGALRKKAGQAFIRPPGDKADWLARTGRVSPDANTNLMPQFLPPWLGQLAPEDQ